MNKEYINVVRFVVAMTFIAVGFWFTYSPLAIFVLLITFVLAIYGVNLIRKHK